MIARIPGISWVLIDCEHGNVADSAMHECIANVAPYGVSPLVRIPDKERWMIKRALDAGAHGIMVPLLNSVAEVEEVVTQVCNSVLVRVLIGVVKVSACGKTGTWESVFGACFRSFGFGSVSQ